MPDKIKEILDKVLAWWNKFTTKQKTIIIGITAVVVFTFAILIHAFTKPQYIQWQQCSTTAESAEIVAILESNNVLYQVSNDGLSIKVKSSQVSIANLALGAAGYVPDDYSFKDAMSGGFSTTQATMDRQWLRYMEGKLAKDIAAMDSVKSAVVTLNIPQNTGTLIDSEEEASAWIQLTLQDRFTSEQAATVARAVATGLGNRSTANITIVDNNANLLFSGEEDYSTAGVANNMMELRAQAETKVGADVKRVLVGSQQFDMIEVACRLQIDFAEYQRTIHEYYTNAGRDEGLLAHRETYEDENTGGSGGLPGTDSNDELTYQFQSGTSSESSSSQTLDDFLPNQLISVENLPPAIINYSGSSLA
ncbi:MAG: flagellar M-ring protein FliF, partial [Lachnospiraceae bacterium]|nr:flagellar M-ring protein FliF [Lachnospiraceae bacterium]